MYHLPVSMLVLDFVRPEKGCLPCPAPHIHPDSAYLSEVHQGTALVSVFLEAHLETNTGMQVFFLGDDPRKHW